MHVRFEFDPAQSDANRIKHGIDFREAQAIWGDPNAIRLSVPRPGLTEQRWLITGRLGDRIWTAVVTYRSEAVRLISVRRARDDEVKAYGEANQR